MGHTKPQQATSVVDVNLVLALSFVLCMPFVVCRVDQHFTQQQQPAAWSVIDIKHITSNAVIVVIFYLLGFRVRSSKR